MSKKASIGSLILAMAFLPLLAFQLKISGFAISTVTGTNTSLSIWDDTDNGLSKYTYNTNCNLAWKTESYWNVHFFANYTKISGEPINSSEGNCKIRFDENNNGVYSSWYNMNYNESSKLWEYNRSFTAKGLLDWQVNCTTTLSNYENLNTSNVVEIKNSEPCIFGKGPGGNLQSFSCYEDSVCYYNFTKNCSDDDLNDILEYKIDKINNETPTNFPWFSMTDGIIKINATFDNETGSFDLALIVGDTPIEDTGTAQDTATLPVTITAVNDKPVFTALPGLTENATEDQWFNFTVTATDEENNTPFYFNLTFVNCSLASWSSRTNCTLFSIDEQTGYISFLPSNDDVGIYWINFSVTDSGTPNATTYQLVTFEVINSNDPPIFTYVCDSERNATEDVAFECYINASDEDENQSLTFISNYSWFTFNNSKAMITVNVTNGTANALVSFTPNDTAVGNHSVKIIVEDSQNSQNQTTISFFVNNTLDNPKIYPLDNKTCFVNITCITYVNASDDDLFITEEGKSIYNESLNFSDNSTLFDIQKISEVYNGSSNVVVGLINFTPTSNDVGSYAINITVTDKTSLTNSTLFILTIENNTLPVWNESKAYSFNLTEDQNFFLNISDYVTDYDNDTITFYASPSSFPSFNLTADGIMNFTPSDVDVNIHSVEIKASDGKGNSSHFFTFNVSNVNDEPILENISDIETQETNETLIYFYARDDDLLIENKTIYNETLTFTKEIINLTGTYRDLFNITVLNVTGNKTYALINFTPVQEDVGNYTVNITVKDISNLTDFKTFNLVILDINNTPVFTETIGNQIAGVNIPFSLNITAKDEDNDVITFYSNTSWFTFNNSETTISVVPKNKIARATVSFTPSSSVAGTHEIKITVSDGNSNSSQSFSLKVYDQPVIVGMNCHNVSENETFSCNGLINQAITEPVNCTLKLGNKVNSTSCSLGNFNLTLKTNFTDEGTYTAIVNVSNPFFYSTANETVSINHGNAPPEFLKDISDIEISGTSTTINLSEYFYDIDHYDVRYNQTMNFSWKQFGNRTACENDVGEISILNINVSSPDTKYYLATFSTDESASAIVKITAIDSENENYNVSSNCFLVNFTVAAQQTTPIGGGGGGRKEEKPVTIRILTPGPISLDALGRITVPIKVENTGEVDLHSIALYALAKRKDIKLKLSKTEIELLKPKEVEEINLTIIANALDVIDIETTEIEIFANVTKPKVEDSAKILLSLIEHNREQRLKAEEKQKLLKEYITSNPECLELEEALEEASKAFKERNYSKAIELAENAIQACKSIVGKEVSIEKPEVLRWPFFTFILIVISIALFIIVFSSYYFKKRKKFK